MRKIILILILLLPIANAQWYYDSETINVDLNINTQLSISRTANSVLEYVRANLSFYPKDDFRQKIMDVKAVPQFDERQDALMFTWFDPTENKLKFDIDYNIDLYNKNVKIKDKIGFPTKIPKDIEIYTKASETIDSEDQMIILLANNIASGEDDLYVVVSKLGQWVKENVEYNLSTLTAQASQKASWVLQNRYGVCDEITTLFIALCRSLNIPAKFTSGLAYTNFADRNDFGPHGWAEVYFPGYGWVIYDVTYGEYGSVNPARIKMKESIDPEESSTRYEWRGRNVDVSAGKLDMNVDVKDIKGKVDHDIALNTRFYKEEVELGSYNLVIGEIENLGDYYQTVDLSASKTSNMKVLDQRTKVIILKPNEKKTVYWTVKVAENLDKDYIYTFPLELYTANNISSKSTFKSKYKAPDYSEEDITGYKEITDEERVYSKNIDISCVPEKEEYLIKDIIKVGCNFKNTGNTFLENLRACVETNCKEFDLGVTQEKYFEYTVMPDKEGQKDLEIKVTNADVSKIDSIKINIADKASLKIDNLEYPAEIEFDMPYTLSFMLMKDSNSAPKNIIVTVLHQGYEKQWGIESLNQDRKIVLNLNSKDMIEGANKFEIMVSYTDNANKEQQVSDEIIINLKDVTFAQKLKIILFRLERWLENLVK